MGRGGASGLALSIRELPREDPRQVAGISVVMKNFGAETKTLSVPQWLFFYKIEGLELSPYGRAVYECGAEGEVSDRVARGGRGY